MKAEHIITFQNHFNIPAITGRSHGQIFSPPTNDFASFINARSFNSYLLRAMTIFTRPPNANLCAVTQSSLR